MSSNTTKTVFTYTLEFYRCQISKITEKVSSTDNPSVKIQFAKM